jgi:hypothetical protein
MNHTYSLYKINDTERFGFSPSDYSRFKFGDNEVAAKFGAQLANGFIKEVLSKSYNGKQLVVISSPYSFIPTATFAMKNHFVFQLNRWLAENRFPVLEETKVHRTVTYKEDYGELDAKERMNLISNDFFHIDKAFLQNKTLVFLDDIKITGSHERMIMKMVKEHDLQNEIHMLYFAELTNASIHPNIENHLNYYEVKSIFDLDSIINSGNFAVNTRIVKYILNSDKASLHLFLQDQAESFINLLYDMSLGNNYHTMEHYSGNVNYIKQHLQTFKILN